MVRKHKSTKGLGEGAHGQEQYLEGMPWYTKQTQAPSGDTAAPGNPRNVCALAQHDLEQIEMSHALAQREAAELRAAAQPEADAKR